MHFSPATSSSDTEKTKIIITKYIEDNINIKLLSTNIKIESSLNVKNKQGIVEDKFTYQPLGDRPIQVLAIHQKNNATSEPDIYNITVRSQIIYLAEPTATIVKDLMNTYFTNPPTIPDCTLESEVYICQNTQTTTTYKKIYMATFEKMKGALSPTLYSCYISKESDNYNNIKTCIDIGQAY